MKPDIKLQMIKSSQFDGYNISKAIINQEKILEVKKEVKDITNLAPKTINQNVAENNHESDTNEDQ